MNLDPLSFSYSRRVDEFRRLYGKGEYYSGPFFRRLYEKGSTAVSCIPRFSSRPDLIKQVRMDFSLRLPEIQTVLRDETSIKLLLKYPDGVRIETVVLLMSRYASLCESTQVGCARGCSFCETGRLGFQRNLTAGEIVAQLLLVQFYLGIRVSNIVFMGMGEPFDNFDQLLTSIEIMSDQRGINIPVSAMTVSTAGHVPGIRRLARIIREEPERGLHRICLAVSLHSADNCRRSEIMPINRVWPLEELRSALLDFPLARKRDHIFIEYTLIPGFNDQPEAVQALLDYLEGIPVCVNIIPCNPVSDGVFQRPTREDVEKFFTALVERGQYCRVRDTRGDSIGAACGQLGVLTRRRPGKDSAPAAAAPGGILFQF